MKRRAVFQLRLTPQEAERLDTEAREKGMTKADLIRTALGWERTEQPVRAATAKDFAAAPAQKQVDPQRQPGLAAIHELARRMKGPR